MESLLDKNDEHNYSDVGEHVIRDTEADIEDKDDEAGEETDHLY